MDPSLLLLYAVQHDSEIGLYEQEMWRSDISHSTLGYQKSTVASVLSHLKSHTQVDVNCFIKNIARKRPP